MKSSIDRGDPEYARIMREAKALFDEQMAKGSMRHRGGRPSNKAKAAAAPVEAEAEEGDELEDAELEAELEGEAADEDAEE